MTSRIPPKVYALTWQGYIAHIMHMVSCIAMSSAYFRHDFCDATYLVYIAYM